MQITRLHWTSSGLLPQPRDNRLRVLPLFLSAGLLLLPVLFQSSPYWQRVLSMVCIYALLALGFDLLANLTGLVSLGGAFFVGVGGYGAALLNLHLGLPPWLSIGLATILGALFCTVLLLPCLPLKGVYFAIATLMYPLLMARLIEALDWFGGSEGFMGVQGLASAWGEQYGLLICLIAALYLLKRLAGSQWGLVLRAIKDDEPSLRASALNPTRFKALALFLAAAMGSLGGAFLSHLYQWAGVSQFALDFSIIPIAAVLVGGAGTLIGAVLGCFILVPLSELLRDFGTLRVVVYALILMTLIIWRSQGLWVYLRRICSRCLGQARP
ncbi:MAG: branched-chain amino acid ABC transporter permease [Desulfarculaceae bacterium]|jgi:branched-chain amino acid transport system permease protein